MASGQVEKIVQDARARLWQPHFLKLGPDFPDLAALKDWLEQRCKALWQEIPHGRLAGTVADASAEEQTALMPVPPAFDGFIEWSKRVSPTCLISFERTRYSVPASFAMAALNAIETAKRQRGYGGPRQEDRLTRRPAPERPAACSRSPDPFR